jgi:hypothetical protein
MLATARELLVVAECAAARPGIGYPIAYHQVLQRGATASEGEGTGGQLRNNAMQSQLPMHQEPPLRSTDTPGEPVPVAGDEERALPDARGAVTRRTQG